MSEYSQYDPDKVILLVGGHRVRAFGESKMVTVEYTSDRRGLRESVDGPARHVEYKSKTGTVTVPLSDYSPSNGVFQIADDGKLIVPIVIKDQSSKGSLFVTQSAMVQKNPAFDRGKDPEDNEWIFQFTNGKIVHTGAKDATLVASLV